MNQMSCLSLKEQKMLQQAAKVAELAQKNKDAARIHLLQIQNYLASRPLASAKRVS